MKPAGTRSAVDDVVVALGASGRRARALLRSRRLRATAGRVAVLAALDDADPGHLTARQLLDRIARARIDVDPASVYRTVATLARLGLVHELAAPDQATSYGVTEHAHHHAVCLNCGTITEIPATDLAGALAQSRQGTRFALGDTGSITLHGLCPDCQRPAAPLRRRADHHPHQ
ncbi:MAG: Fur family transcriptional regulator [Mycobacteriales bacterium]